MNLDEDSVVDVENAFFAVNYLLEHYAWSICEIIDNDFFKIKDWIG